MHPRSIVSLFLVVVVVGCSKNEERPAPPAGSTTTTAPTPPSQTAQTPSTQEDDEPDAMGMTSGVAGATTGQAAAVAKSTTEAASTVTASPRQISSERLAHEYLKSTKLGRTYPNELVLIKTKKGKCETCWFFTYRVGGKQEVTVQTADNVASIFGTMNDEK